MKKEVVLKIKQLREGRNIAIYPFSRDFGDPFTAVGYPCPGQSPDLPMELKEPFKAVLLSYSGTVLMIRTINSQCLLIEAEFIGFEDSIMTVISGGIRVPCNRCCIREVH